MIYKPRCEYARAQRKTSALFCSKINGYCTFQYRCEQTGQWENTPTAKGCKARKPKEEKTSSSENSVFEIPKLQKNSDSVEKEKFHGSEPTVEVISKKDLEFVENMEQTAQKSTMPLNEVAYAISDAVEQAKTTIEPVSERSNVTDEVERSENKTARRASGTKRGRRKKRDNISPDVAQTSTGESAGERVHPEG